MRDACEYDVLDEALILDGALDAQRYKALVICQAEVVDEPVLEKFAAYAKAGGRLVVVGSTPIKDVAGRSWSGAAGVERVDPKNGATQWLPELTKTLIGLKGVDGKLDGLWTSRRGAQTFVYNSTDKAVTTEIAGKSLQVEPHSIYDDPGQH